MAKEISVTFAGTEYPLRLEPSSVEMMEATFRGEYPAGQRIPVTYTDDDIEDEVDAIWLACITQRFDVCRSLLELGREEVPNDDEPTPAQTLLLLVQKAVRSGSAELVEKMMECFSGGEEGWKVLSEELFSGDMEEEMETCVAMGFRAVDALFAVGPQQHRLALLVAKATPDSAANPSDTTPFCEGSSLCPADLALLRGLAEKPPVLTSLAVESRHAATPDNVEWVGHVLYALVRLLPVSGSLFTSFFSSDACWQYISERDVPESHLVVRLPGGKVARYSCRLDRIRREELPTLPQDILRILQKEISERQVKAPPVDTGLLVDPVLESIKAVVSYSPPVEEESVDTSTPEGLKKAFSLSAERVKTVPKLSNEVKLSLYSHYKQALEGDCTNPRPGMLDFQGRAKWDAWTKLSGMEQQAAMLKYIEIVKSVTS